MEKNMYEHGVDGWDRLSCVKSNIRNNLKEKQSLRTYTQYYKVKVVALGARRAKRTPLMGTHLGWVRIFSFPIIF